jgi:hypothetical protein
MEGRATLPKPQPKKRKNHQQNPKCKQTIKGQQRNVFSLAVKESDELLFGFRETQRKPKKERT